MIVKCPRCDRLLGAMDVNVAKDVAVCPGCSNAFALSSIVSSEPAVPVDLASPPGGAWARDVPGGFVIGASTRSMAALFLVPFMAVWSGVSLGTLYGQQLVSGRFSLVASVFGLPFVAGTVLLGSVAAMAIAGTVTVTVEHDAVTIFTGAFGIGRKQRVRWSEVISVAEVPPQGRQSARIWLQGPGRLEFGSQLSDARRWFVIQALRARVQPAAMAPAVAYRS